MASGHVSRFYRPNTWQHRPSLRREDFSCQPGAVHTWHIATFRCDVELGHYRGIADIEQRCTRSTPRNDDISSSALKFPQRHAAPFHRPLRGNDVQCVAINPKRHITTATNTLSLIPLSGHSGRGRTCCSLAATTLVSLAPTPLPTY